MKNIIIMCGLIHCDSYDIQGHVTCFQALQLGLLISNQDDLLITVVTFLKLFAFGTASDFTYFIDLPEVAQVSLYNMQ